MKHIFLFLLALAPALALAQTGTVKDSVRVLTTAEIEAGAANDTANFYFIQDGSWKKIRMDSVFNYLRFRGMVDTIRNQTILGAKTFATAPTFNTALGGGSGGTGLTTFGAANRIPYSTSTTALTTGAGLTYDGTNFATAGTASATKFIPTSGGTNTGNGMYLPSSNTLGFSTNGGLRMQINSAGNIGLNIAPNANWESAWRVIQINNATFGSSTVGGMIFGHNIYYDGSAYRIINTDEIGRAHV